MNYSQGVLLVLVLASISLQAAAAIMALRLIGVTGKRWAWICISIAISLMTIRRGFSLSKIFSGETLSPWELDFEALGLVTSVMMLAGVALIRPLFQAIRDSATERERLIGELQTALASIKTLHGLLPICADCNKIRDEKGSWNMIEVYIREHSGAEFSHDICPECAKLLHPEHGPVPEYYHPPPK